MIKVDCLKGHSAVNSRSYIDKKTGEQKFMHSQNLYAHLGGAFPEMINVSIEDPMKPIEEGSYTLGSGIFQVGNFGRLEINSYEIVKNLKKV